MRTKAFECMSKSQVNLCHLIQVSANIWHCKHAIRMNHSEILTVAILAMHFAQDEVILRMA